MSITITWKTVKRVVLALAAMAAVILLVLLVRNATTDGLPERLEDNSAHAVTLSSGELYFGTLEAPKNGFYELRNVHVVRERPADGKDAQPVREVIKFSQQSHKPEDALLIREDQLVSVQTLKPSSEIAKVMRKG